LLNEIEFLRLKKSFWERYFTTSLVVGTLAKLLSISIASGNALVELLVKTDRKLAG